MLRNEKLLLNVKKRAISFIRKILNPRDIAEIDKKAELTTSEIYEARERLEEIIEKNE